MKSICLLLMISFVNTAYSNYSNYHDSIGHQIKNDVTFIVNDTSFFVQDGSPFKLVFKYYDTVGLVHVISLHKGKNYIPLETPTLFIQGNDLVRTPYLVFPNTTIHVQLNWDGSISLVTADSITMHEMNFFKVMLDSMNFLTVKFSIPKSADSIQRIALKNKIQQQIDTLTAKQLFFLNHYQKESLRTETIAFFKNCIRTINTLSTTYLGIGSKTADKWLYHLSDSIFQMSHPVPYQFSKNFNDPYFFELLKILFNYQCFGNYYHSIVDSVTVCMQYHLNRITDVKLQDVIKKNLFTQKDAYLKNIPDENDYQLGFSQDSLLVINLRDKISLHDLLRKFHGKTILIDTWASWCGPCMADMPFLKRIIQTMNKDSFVLLHFSIDSDLLSWVKSSEAESLASNQSYCFSDWDASIFNRRFSIISIPRYILIDKTGNVITDRAPSPSSEYHTLQELIEKHMH